MFCRLKTSPILFLIWMLHTAPPFCSGTQADAVEWLDESCPLCHEYGPSYKRLLTLYFNAYPMEEAFAVCREDGGSLLHFSELKDDGKTLVKHLWQPFFEKKAIRVLTGDTNATSCEALFTGSRKFYLYDGEVVRASDRNEQAQFICSKIQGPCEMLKLVNTSLNYSAINENMTFPSAREEDCAKSCLLHTSEAGECWFSRFNDSVCHLYITNASVFDRELMFKSEGSQPLFMKECYDSTVKFDDRPMSFGIRQYSQGYFCPIKPEDSDFPPCPLREQDKTTTTPTSPTPPDENTSSSEVAVTSEIPQPTSSFILSSTASSSQPVEESTLSIQLESSMVGYSTVSQAYSLATSTMALLTTTVSALPKETLTTLAETTSQVPPNRTEIVMSTKTTVALVSSTAALEDTSCDCTCIVEVIHPRAHEEFIASIMEDLKIDEKQTARNKRRYRSVHRDRSWPTLSVGYFGVIVVVVIFGSIILMDVRTLARDMMMMFHNLRQVCHEVPNTEFAEDEYERAAAEKREAHAQDVARYNAMVAEICAETRMYKRRSAQLSATRNQRNERVGRRSMDFYTLAE